MPAACAWLAEQSIEHEGECVLRRIVGADGRSRAYVNSQAMPVQALRQLGETLVDIHGQMEYQSLMKRAAQRELLDQSGDYRELLDSVAEQHRAWSELREQRDRAAASAQDREARLELLRYHLGELKALDLKTGEIDELTAERQRLSQHGRLASGAREILQLLRETEDMNAEHAVSRALTVSRSLSELDRAVRLDRQGDRRKPDRAARGHRVGRALRSGPGSRSAAAGMGGAAARGHRIHCAQASRRARGTRRAARGAGGGISAARYAGSIARADREKARRSCRRNFAPRAPSSAPRASQPQASCRGESAS